MDKMTKAQAEQILRQLIDGTRLTKPEYDALIKAVEVLKG